VMVHEQRTVVGFDFLDSSRFGDARLVLDELQMHRRRDRAAGFFCADFSHGWRAGEGLFLFLRTRFVRIVTRTAARAAVAFRVVVLVLVIAFFNLFFD